MRGKLDEKRVRELVDEGWRFSVKKTGKYRYIRRRRVGSRDVNEGPYSEEAWENIRRVQEPAAGPRVDPREVLRLRLELHYQLSLSRARDRPKTCAHVQGGFCTYWRWEPGEHLFLATLAELDEHSRMLWGSPHVSSMLAGDGKLLVRAGTDYCKDCTEYVRGDAMDAEAPASEGSHV